jgi:hypothetical protein
MSQTSIHSAMSNLAVELTRQPTLFIDHQINPVKSILFRRPRGTLPTWMPSGFRGFVWRPMRGNLRHRSNGSRPRC